LRNCSRGQSQEAFAQAAIESQVGRETAAWDTVPRIGGNSLANSSSEAKRGDFRLGIGGQRLRHDGTDERRSRADCRGSARRGTFRVSCPAFAAGKTGSTDAGLSEMDTRRSFTDRADSGSDRLEIYGGWEGSAVAA